LQDNFYECGIDSLMRWKTDFEEVFQGPATPFIAKLKWLTVIGRTILPATERHPRRGSGPARERKKERPMPVSRRALRGHSVNEDHRRRRRPGSRLAEASGL
jgi:hypothetical protein